MLRGINQTKTDTAWYQLSAESKKAKLVKHRAKWLPGAWGWKNRRDVVSGYKLATSRRILEI